MADLIGYREYARHRGCTLRTVQEAIETGRIKVVDVDGKKKIDRQQADIDWQNNTDHSKRNIIYSSGPKLNEEENDLDFEDDEIADEEEKVPSVSKPVDLQAEAYRHSRTERESINVEKARLELEQMRGKLIPVTQVKRTAFTAFRTLRDSVLNVPLRVKDECAAETDPLKIEYLLERELTAALNVFNLETVLRDAQEEEDF
jgi:alkylated DNA nucleotide flippase Atl1